MNALKRLSTNRAFGHLANSAEGSATRINVEVQFTGIRILHHQASFEFTGAIVRLGDVPELGHNRMSIDVMKSA